MAGQHQEKPFIFYSDKLNFKSIEGAKGREYWVEGYISTGDMDLVNDVVTKNCMSSMMNQFDARTIKLDFEHEAFRGKDTLSKEAAKTRLALGKAVSKNIDNTGVSVKWKLNPTWKKFDEKGNVVMDFKELWQNVEEGYYDAFSIAYVPTRTQEVSRQGKTVRMLDDVNLLNVALTGNPINPAAKMGAVMAKSLEYMNQKSSEEMDMEQVEIKSRLDKIESTLQEIKDQSNSYGHKASEERKGCKTMTEKKDEENQDSNAQNPDTQDQGAEQKGNDQKEAGKKSEDGDKKEDEGKKETEGKSADFSELKSAIESLSKEVKDLKKENEDLKAIVEKAQHKSKGAESNEQKSQSNQEVKSVGPLDMI